ncbi:unnamed protein product [Moneuplotes crassus]|uniref:Uncharacterized protein n=1 Tax=Euplotes crassus TaxID=5936 RepID=A0AAD1X958_EUPCR|nr:unnamed protein product [Moneuplotes crassus]
MEERLVFHKLFHFLTKFPIRNCQTQDRKKRGQNSILLSAFGSRKKQQQRRISPEKDPQKILVPNKTSVHFYEDSKRKSNDIPDQYEEISEFSSRPRTKAFAIQNAGSLFSSKTARSYKTQRSASKSKPHGPSLHLTSERKKFIMSMSKKNFYREKSNKIHKNLDSYLNISSCTLAERPEESYEFERSNTTSMIAKRISMKKRAIEEANSSVTFHERLPSGEFVVKNALAHIPDHFLPKKERKATKEYEFIKKMQGYLKTLKLRKSGKRIKKLKSFISKLDQYREPEIKEVTTGKSFQNPTGYLNDLKSLMSRDADYVTLKDLKEMREKKTYSDMENLSKHVLSHVKKIHLLGLKHSKNDASIRESANEKPLTEEDELEIQEEVHNLKVKYKLKKPRQKSMKKLAKNRDLLTNCSNNWPKRKSFSRVNLKASNDSYNYQPENATPSEYTRLSKPRVKTAVHRIRSKKHKSMIDNILKF